MEVLAPLELPEDLVRALEIPGSEPWSSELWFWLVPPLLVLLWLFSRSRRRRQRKPNIEPPTPVAPRSSSIGDAIRELQKRYRESTSVREGCHELSELLRDHYDRHPIAKLGASTLSRLTAHEIWQRLGRHPVAELFSDLARQQFSRREPKRHAFRDLCRRALRLVETKAPIRAGAAGREP